MKDSALRRLFEILGQEGNYTFSKGYARNLDSLAALYEKLSASLRGEQLRDFKKLCECFDESNAGESECSPALSEKLPCLFFRYSLSFQRPFSFRP